LGFTKSKADSNLYFKVMNDEPMILLLYVDDLFLTGEENLITECKKRLTSEFEMKDLGLMHYFLGLEVWQSPERIFLNQGKYAVEILKRFDMLECKSMNTPMETKLKLLVDTYLSLSHLIVLLYTTTLKLEARYSSCFTSQPSGWKQDTRLALHHSYPTGSSVVVSSYHLALRVATRSEARNISSCFMSDIGSEARNISSCFTSDNSVRSKEQLILLYV
jgi:hypothetical protein